MVCGRHLLMVGVLAGAGLVSVRDNQTELALGYSIARSEQQLDRVRKDIETERVRLQTLQAPERIIAKAVELRLDLGASSRLDPYATPQQQERERKNAQRVERPAPQPAPSAARPKGKTG